jgi:predicted transcriptional regulator
MGRTFHDVTDTELAVLQVLWEQGSATRRRITDALYPDGGPAHYTTVQKLLERLEAKGHVRKRLVRGVQTFKPTLARADLIQHRLRDMADKLCGGSVTPLMMNLIQAQALSSGELEELRALIDQLRRPNQQP